MKEKVPLLKGREAIKAATGFDLSVDTVRGSTLPTLDGEWAVASIPRDWLSMPSMVPLAAKDSKRAERWEPVVPNVQVLPADEVLERFERDMPSHVAVDIEDPGEDIDLIGVSWGIANTYVMQNQTDPRALRTVEHIAKQATLVFHNAAYDVPALQRALWMDIPKYEDTAVLAAVVDPSFRMGLEKQVLAWVAGTTTWKGLVDFGAGWQKETAKTKVYEALWVRLLDRLNRTAPVTRFGWYVLYNGLDVCNTWRLWACHQFTLHQQERLGYYNDLLKPLHPYLIDMGERGLPVDEARRAEHVAALDKRIDAAMAVLNPVAKDMLQGIANNWQDVVDGLEAERQHERDGKKSRLAFSKAKELTSARNKLKTRQAAVEKGFNLDSTPQRRALLYDHLKLPKLKERFTGKVRTDNGALQELLKRLWEGNALGRYKIKDEALGAPRQVCADVLEAMIDGKEAMTWKRNFCLSPVVPGKAFRRPRMQTEYSLHRTATGRLASGTNPNRDYGTRKRQQLQNVPKKLRDIYAADPGYVMVGGDLSNIEWALVQWDAMHVPSATKERLGIPKNFHRELLARFLRRELDAHRYLASIAFDKPENQITADERQECKPFTHGLNYLGKEENLARNAGQPPENGRRAGKAHDEAFKPKGWWEVVLHAADTNRYVETVLGWRRTFHGDYIHPPEVPATRIQSLAADLCKWLLFDLFRNCPAEWEILTTTHDSFLMQVPEADGEKAKAWLKERMEQPVPWLENYAFLADVAVGPTWKDV